MLREALMGNGNTGKGPSRHNQEDKCTTRKKSAKIEKNPHNKSSRGSVISIGWGSALLTRKKEGPTVSLFCSV